MDCRACATGFHSHCDDPGPGQPCTCQCPADIQRPTDRTSRLDHSRKLREVRRLERQIRQLDDKIARLRGELRVLVQEDPLAPYRRPEDRVLGARRLEAATKELYAA